MTSFMVHGVKPNQGARLTKILYCTHGGIVELPLRLVLHNMA